MLFGKKANNILPSFFFISHHIASPPVPPSYHFALKDKADERGDVVMGVLANKREPMQLQNEAKSYEIFQLELRKLGDSFLLLEKNLLEAIELIQNAPKAFNSIETKTGKATQPSNSYQSWLKKMAEVEAKIQKLGSTCEIAGNIIQKNIFEVMKSKANKNNQDEWMKTSLPFYRAMNEACLYYKKWIARALRER